jgi:hypothetical protein
MPAFYPEGDEPKLADPSGRSLHKINNLLKSIDAKTGSTTITGPVTVNNEVEVTNSTGNPIPVSGTVTVNDMTSGNAKTKIVDSVGADVSYITAGTAGTPSAGVLSVQGISGGVSLPISGSVETGLAQPLTDTQLRALAVPVSLASAPVTPVTDNNGSLTVDGSVSVSNFPATQPVSGSISVSNFPATQPVSLATAPTTPVTGTFWQATQPVSIASAPVTPVTDNGGSLTVDGTVTANVSGTVPVSGTFWQTTQPISGTVTANTGLTQPLTDTQLRAASVPVSQATAANLNATVVGSGSFTAAQATASSLKAQAQILDPSGSLLTYAATGTAGTPAVDVVSVQGVSSGVAIATQIRNNAGSPVTYAESGVYGNPSVDVISVQNPQGTSATIATFTSTTASSSLVSASTTRKTLTVYNSGPGDLNISPTATCTTTNFQIRLASNDYWECPAQQVTLAHTAVYSTSGTAYVTTVT